MTLSRKTTETAVVATSSFAAKPACKIEVSPAATVSERPASLERTLEKTAAYFPEWKTKILRLEGSPARVIIRRAEEWKAD